MTTAGDLDWVVGSVIASPLFERLPEEQVKMICDRAELAQFKPGQLLVEQAQPSDSFFILLKGQARVTMSEGGGDPIEVGRISSVETMGEMGMLLSQPRSANVQAVDEVSALRFSKQIFGVLLEKVPGFGLSLSQELARRVQQVSRRVQITTFDVSAAPPSEETLALLPTNFLSRHRLLPLKAEGTTLVLGFVDDPTASVISRVQQLLPSMQVQPVRVSLDDFNAVLSGMAGGDWAREAVKSGGPRMSADFEVARARTSPRLDSLLERMVEEGASDLHLSAGHRARWRVDGDLVIVSDSTVLKESEVFELLRPVMEDRHIKVFEETSDADFSYAIEGLARFRVNLFRDNRGVCTVLRVIPSKILSIEQLGLPPVVSEMCRAPKGLIVVTGPTGSGKSTTLAAMVDHMNATRRSHIITLEDPIEFVHQSKQSLINQREVGSHTRSFTSALKSALREDPDIVLVGEMRDLETVSLAIETANTGHLVLGTLHTSTAISTIDRIIEIFPHEMQEQVRSSLADSLRGVIAQTLLKRAGGGRVAALETLVVNHAVAHRIRDASTNQIINTMQTGLKEGNILLNASLAKLVNDQVVTEEEALAKALDKPDLERRLKARR